MTIKVSIKNSYPILAILYSSNVCLLSSLTICDFHFLNRFYLGMYDRFTSSLFIPFHFMSLEVLLIHTHLHAYLVHEQIEMQTCKWSLW